MTEFNDRRLTESQKSGYVRPDVKKAVDTHLESGHTRRVLLEFNSQRDEHGGSTRYSKTGYLRADESGNPALYPNARSNKGQSVDVANLASINSSRKSRNGEREAYWSRWSGPYKI